MSALERLRSRLCVACPNSGVVPHSGGEPFWDPEVDPGVMCRSGSGSGDTGEILLLSLGLEGDRPEPLQPACSGKRGTCDATDRHFPG